MLTSPDFRELLSLLSKHSVRYLVVGGYAVIPFISKKDLIRTKEASGRDQDRIDVQKLKKTID